MLIQHMIATRGVNFSFKAAQKLAAELAQEHISTIEEAEAVFQRSEAAMKGARRVLSRLGMRRSPSMDEVDLYLKWTEQWGFEPKAVEAGLPRDHQGLADLWLSGQGIGRHPQPQRRAGHHRQGGRAHAGGRAGGNRAHPRAASGAGHQPRRGGRGHAATVPQPDGHGRA